MAVQKILTDQFVALSQQHPVLDVRSPGEYSHAHIPGAYSLPLFTDEERKVVGTAYKQESREKAIRIGLDYFGVKMRKMVEEVEQLVSRQKQDYKTGDPLFQNTVLVHCWRGGMRSEGVAWLLNLYGFKVFTLVGGYKSYRRWVRSQFQKECDCRIIGGFTGSGKTLVLHELKRAGKPVIDLEAIASHKGSAFGAFGLAPQPSQEMFENLLAIELLAASRQTGSASTGEPGQPIYLEDESRRIGNLNIPGDLWDTLQKTTLIFIDIPFEERLDHIVQQYGKFDKEKIVTAIIRIQKRLGGQETKNAINFLLENDQRAGFAILLKYYDKCYRKALLVRENVPGALNKITCANVDINTIINTLINERAIA